jgi:hypothetical protein
LPEGRTNIAQEFIRFLDGGGAGGGELHPTLDPDINLEVMAILDAGVRSANSGKLASVRNVVWQIG